MNLRQAAQQALEYMRSVGPLDMYPEDWAIAVALEKALAEPEQEPVAFIGTNGELGWLKKPNTLRSAATPLYTAPTPRKPLTDEEIALIVGECAASAYRHDDFSFARAIEAAHGIKEKP